MQSVSKNKTKITTTILTTKRSKEIRNITKKLSEKLKYN